MAGLTIRVGAFSLVQVDSINAAADTASVLLHSLLRISEMLLIVVDHVDILGFVVEIKTANAGQKRGGITQTSHTHVSLGGRALCPMAAYLPGQCREMAHSHNVSSRPRAVCRTASLALFHQAGEVCLEVLGGNVLGVGDMWRGRESGRRGARGRKGRAVP